MAKTTRYILTAAIGDAVPGDTVELTNEQAESPLYASRIQLGGGSGRSAAELEESAAEYLAEAKAAADAIVAEAEEKAAAIVSAAQAEAMKLATAPKK